VGAALSAAGGLLSDLTQDYAVTLRTTDRNFDFDGVNARLAALLQKCSSFIHAAGAAAHDWRVELSVEARYPHQAWELEVPLVVDQFRDVDDVRRASAGFHDAHDEVFAIADRESPVEFESWRARAVCRMRDTYEPPVFSAGDLGPLPTRDVYFGADGEVTAAVAQFDELPVGHLLSGPAIVESDFTTIILDPDAVATRSMSGSLIVAPRSTDSRPLAAVEGSLA
jgi:N-methylhydantoinase A